MRRIGDKKNVIFFGNKGQMKLSFGMIFSIILIIIFMLFAFFAIKKILNIMNAAQIGDFKDSLQTDIDKVWRGQEADKEKEYFLPSKIKEVCFAEYENDARAKPPGNAKYEELKQNWFGGENMFFYPIGSGGSLESTRIKNINMEELVFTRNPYCIKNEDGKIKIKLKKAYGENLVLIE